MTASSSVWAVLSQVAAVWLADAALQLQHPEAPMYAHLNKLVGKRPALDLQACLPDPNPNPSLSLASAISLTLPDFQPQPYHFSNPEPGFPCKRASRQYCNGAHSHDTQAVRGHAR